MASLNTDAYDHFIEIVREARREKGVSQEKLSEMLGYSQNFILKIEHKDRRVDVVEFVQIADALGIEPEDLLRRFLRRCGRKPIA